MSEIIIGCAEKDSAAAEALAERLAGDGFPAEILREEDMPGAGEILEQARIYIVLFSGETNSSGRMQESLRMAAASETVIMPVRLTDDLPTDAFQYYLGAIHWMDGRGERLDEAFGLLSERCRAVLTAVPEKPKKKKWLPAVICAAVLLACGIAAVLLIGGKPAAAGDIIRFGRYEQDGNEANGPEEIEWIVLKADSGEGTLLMISRYCLDSVPYNETRGGVTWAASSMRAWLNGEFISTAFSDRDRERILKTELDNSVTQSTVAYSFGQVGGDGGENTEDSAWLLSTSESEYYFHESKDRAASFTERMKQAGGSGECAWWLRSPGKDSGTAMIVKANGSRTSVPMNGEGYGVRPVIRVTVP